MQNNCAKITKNKFVICNTMYQMPILIKATKNFSVSLDISEKTRYNES